MRALEWLHHWVFQIYRQVPQDMFASSSHMHHGHNFNFKSHQRTSRCGECVTVLQVQYCIWWSVAQEIHVLRSNIHILSLSLVVRSIWSYLTWDSGFTWGMQASSPVDVADLSGTRQLTSCPALRNWLFVSQNQTRRGHFWLGVGSSHSRTGCRVIWVQVPENARPELV